MVANLPIGGNEEVFNTYGDGLTNAQLLCHYGFMLDGNENDSITWTTDELLQINEKDAAKTEREGSLLPQWKVLASRLLNHWDGSQMVYNPTALLQIYERRKSQADESGSGNAIEGNNDDGLTGSTTDSLNPTSGCMNLNADGQVSVQLWVQLFLIALANVEDKLEVEDMIKLTDITAERQVHIEQVLMANVEEGGDPGPSLRVNEGNRTVEHRALKVTTNNTDINEISIVQKIADLVVEICGRKLQSVHAPELSEVQIGEMLDVSPNSLL